MDSRDCFFKVSINPSFVVFTGKYEFDTDLGATSPELLPLYKKWHRVTAEELVERQQSVRSSLTGGLLDHWAVKHTEVEDTVNPLARNKSQTKPKTGINIFKKQLFLLI